MLHPAVLSSKQRAQNGLHKHPLLQQMCNQISEMLKFSDQFALGTLFSFSVCLDLLARSSSAQFYPSSGYTMQVLNPCFGGEGDLERNESIGSPVLPLLCNRVVFTLLQGILQQKLQDIPPTVANCP